MILINDSFAIFAPGYQSPLDAELRVGRMSIIFTSVQDLAASSCAYCASRHKGACLGVGDEDADGAAALERAHSPVRLYEAGEPIYAQGDPAEHVFNLISGWVALFRDIADGRRHIIRFLPPGALFGIEPAGQELGHSATAITTATVCPMVRSRFDDLRHQIPSLNERFIELLERDNRQTAETMTVVAQGSAKERIVALVTQLAVAATGETSVRVGSEIEIPLTQRQIAEATGLTTIHVNRVLRQLGEDRVIELRDRVVVASGKREALAATGSG